MDYEYRVIPAPKRLKKIRGVSSTAELFASTLTDCINAEARQGWEYVRAEALAAEQPRGWLRRGAMVEETMLIFRRSRGHDGSREPVLQEISRREPAPSATRAAPQAPTTSDRPRPLSSLLSRGESNRPEPLDPKPRSGPGAPLLRPVPRHKPGDKS